MPTYLDDIRRRDPRLADAHAIAGNQDRTMLRNMVRALTFSPWRNTQEDRTRLAAAQFVLAPHDAKKRAAFIAQAGLS